MLCLEALTHAKANRKPLHPQPEPSWTSSRGLAGTLRQTPSRTWEALGGSLLCFLLLFRQKAALPAPEAAREADEAGGEGVRGWGVIGSL